MAKGNAYIDMLGRTGQDKVTGFRGVVSSVSFDLYGCVRVALSPRRAVSRLGPAADLLWFDANRIEIHSAVARVPVPEFTAKPAEHSHGPAEKGKPR